MRTQTRWIAFASALGLAAVAIEVACAPLDSGYVVLDANDEDGLFAAYSGQTSDGGMPETNTPEALLALRCASLDCHGQLGRPLRIFSRSGLRERGVDDAGHGVPLMLMDGTPLYTNDDMGNEAPLTEEEQTLNFQAILGLEPENFRTALLTGDPSHLLLLQKPLDSFDKSVPQGGEGHKGGPIFSGRSDPGYSCLSLWVRMAPIADLTAACKLGIAESP